MMSVKVLRMYSKPGIPHTGVGILNRHDNCSCKHSVTQSIYSQNPRLLSKIKKNKLQKGSVQTNKSAQGTLSKKHNASMNSTLRFSTIKKDIQMREAV